MQKTFQLLLVTVAASLILLMASVPVNHGPVASAGKGGTRVADGVPLPTPPPVPPKKKPSAALLTADGVPLPTPPPVPPKKKPGSFA
jgi:hypothetical protein